MIDQCSSVTCTVIKCSRIFLHVWCKTHACYYDFICRHLSWASLYRSPPSQAAGGLAWLLCLYFTAFMNRYRLLQAGSLFQICLARRACSCLSSIVLSQLLFPQASCRLQICSWPSICCSSSRLCDCHGAEPLPVLGGSKKVSCCQCLLSNSSHDSKAQKAEAQPQALSALPQTYSTALYLLTERQACVVQIFSVLLYSDV